MLPRPHPSPSDIALATEFVDSFMREYLRPDDTWFRCEREKAIRQMAVAEMQKRQHDERIARQAPVRRGIAA